MPRTVTPAYHTLRGACCSLRPPVTTGPLTRRIGLLNSSWAGAFAFYAACSTLCPMTYSRRSWTLIYRTSWYFLTVVCVFLFFQLECISTSSLGWRGFSPRTLFWGQQCVCRQWLGWPSVWPESFGEPILQSPREYVGPLWKPPWHLALTVPYLQRCCRAV